MSLTVGSLFSGIGGLELGLERAGMLLKFQVEIDLYCRAVLNKHWPDATRYEDIRAIDWSKVEPVDLVCGGFPCQPVSLAGRRRGMEDARWLWPEFARCIREFRPRIVLVENVPGLYSAGFGAVLGDLAEGGYDAEWDLLSAQAVGAPHVRKRIFLVAWDPDRCGFPHEQVRAIQEGDGPDPRRVRGDVPDAEGERFAARRLPLGAGAEIARPAGERRDGALPNPQGFGCREGRTESEGLEGGPDPAERGRPIDPADAERDGRGSGTRRARQAGIGRGESRRGGQSPDVPDPERLGGERRRNPGNLVGAGSEAEGEGDQRERGATDVPHADRPRERQPQGGLGHVGGWPRDCDAEPPLPHPASGGFLGAGGDLREHAPPGGSRGELAGLVRVTGEGRGHLVSFAPSRGSRQLRWVERPPGGEGLGDLYWPRAQSGVRGGPDGVPAGLDGAFPGGAEDGLRPPAEWEAAFPILRDEIWCWGIAPVAPRMPARKPRLRSLGNAVVPACAEYLGRLILERFGRRPDA